MAQPYIGEIRMFGGNFAPVGWKFCDGSLLPISDNEALFQLIGTTYGGDGQETFALPDLRGRIPVHRGNGTVLAEMGGAEAVTLTEPQIPVHTHVLQGHAAPANRRNPRGSAFAQTFDPLYAPAGVMAPLDAAALGSTGSTQPHTNMQPYLCVNFVISLFGIFPNQT